MNINGFKSFNGLKVNPTDSSNKTTNQYFGVQIYSTEKNSDSINFTGLTRYFSSANHNAENLVQAAEKWTKNNGVIGTPPYEWVQKIPKELRKRKIKELYFAFKDAVDDLNIYSYNTKPSEKKLDAAFKNAGIINPSENISFTLLSYEGRFGNTYKFSVPISKNETKHYVLKVFRSHFPQKLRPESELIHGNYVEQNRAFFKQKDFYTITRKAGKSKNFSRSEWHRADWPKIFFADVRSNYALFEDAKALLPPPRRIFWVDSGLQASDFNPDNIENFYYVDYGGIKIENPFIADNKTARYIYRKIMHSTHPFNKLKFYMKNAHKMKNTQDIYTGITAVVSHIERNWKLKDYQFSFDDKIKFVQKIIDNIGIRMKPSEAKTYLISLPEEHKQKIESDQRILNLLGM